MTEIADKYGSVIRLCERHRLIDLRREEIHGLLGQLEEVLADRHRWFSLTRVQRRQLPAAQPFYDLEDELERLSDESAQVVVDLRCLKASTLREAVAKLQVAARVIDPDDYPDAHEVLASAIEEALALSSR